MYVSSIGQLRPEWERVNEMRRINVGDTVTVKLPWSEVCMHMGVQDQWRQVRVEERQAVIVRPDGRQWCSGITHGEAGIYRDAEGFYTDDLTYGVCMWVLMCENDATHTQSHPILGEVPICDRCQATYDKNW